MYADAQLAIADPIHPVLLRRRRAACAKHGRHGLPPARVGGERGDGATDWAGFGHFAGPPAGNHDQCRGPVPARRECGAGAGGGGWSHRGEGRGRWAAANAASSSRNFDGPVRFSTGSGLILLAQRPGYLPSRQGVAVALDATVSTQSTVLRLMPAATIQGRVAATGSESLSGIRVQLLHRVVQDGRPSWQMASVRQVSEDGSFHMTELQPGEYTLATAEWVPRTQLLTGMPARSEQYPPDFLGDTRTLDGATKLHLAYGQAAQANLHLRAVPYYAVTIPVQGLPPNAPANVRVSAGTGFQLYQLGWNGRDSTVEGALPDGDYMVTVSSFGQQRASARIPLHVAGAPVVHAPAGMVPTQDVPISVRDERTQTSASSTGNGSSGIPLSGAGQHPNVGFYLNVRSEDAEGGGGMMTTTPSGPALQNLAPGRYYLQGSATGPGYIAAMSCDGVNLLTGPLVVNDSGHTAPVEVTLRDDGGTISGIVDFRNSGLQAAGVIILPTDGSGHVVYGYANVSSGTNTGKFLVSNIAPGSYRVFATPADQPGTLPYLDAQAMRQYDTKGAAVTVMAGQTAQVEAELIGLDGTSVEP